MKRIFVVLSLIAILTSGCGSATKTTITTSDNKTSVVTEVVSKSEGKQFADDTLDSFVRSVSSTVDTTWQFNVSEPLDNYKAGSATKESVLDDLQLAADMFELKAKEIEKFVVPSDIKFNDSEPRNKYVIDTLNTLKEDLSKAVRSRGEVAKQYIKKIKAGMFASMTQEEMDNLLIMPNSFLQIAMIDYKAVLENIE
ncbi:hypothetical protein P4H66_06130 [Paenibacillus dokdonensis]|uniref:Lipoprotein n=1 Tax=Paenibacillus dokdonensis TaxID=2567944 RepID=A0ABU6GI74_9BACL|nr:hypothetical protein [Paenibacillus dokdonensis]MEC0239432.1 hypothetical protein [Paenibacillus dokdonensis]